MWKTLLKYGKVLVVKVLRVARVKARFEETDCTIEITTGCFEWAIGAIGSGGTIGVCQAA